MEVDIKKLKAIKEELDALDEKDPVLYVSENGNAKYALMPIELLDEIEDILHPFDDEDGQSDGNSASIKVISSNPFELSYDEYEEIKDAILKAFDKTFKPKPEKLN